MDTAEWEDLCLEEGGWEYIDLQEEKEGLINEFGEKRGVDRLWEALEANVWETGRDMGEIELGEEGGIEEEGEGDVAGMQAGLMAGENYDGVGGEDGGGSEEDVRALENMMVRLQAVRDSGADLPEQERKKMAKQAVEEVMKGL